MAKLTVEIRERVMSCETSETYWRGIVTTCRGNCYSATWAGEKPTEATVRETWKVEKHKVFSPFNCTKP